MSPDDHHNETDADNDFMAALNSALEGIGVEQKIMTSNGVERRVKGTVPADEKFQLQNISHTHEAIMNWLVANPTRSLGECAGHFRVSASWLSILIHSDLFKARLREKQDVVFNTIVASLDDKLGAMADVGITKLSTAMEHSADPKLLLEGTKLALQSLGFGKTIAPTGGNVNATNVQQNFYVASPADLVAARGRMQQNGGSAPTVVLEHPMSGEALQQESPAPGPLPLPGPSEGSIEGPV